MNYERPVTHRTVKKIKMSYILYKYKPFPLNYLITSPYKIINFYED